MDTKQMLLNFTRNLEMKGYNVFGESITTYRNSFSFSCRITGDDLEERYLSAHGDDPQSLESDFYKDYGEMPSASSARDAKFTELALVLARQAKDRGYAEIVIKQLTELSKALSENILTDQRPKPYDDDWADVFEAPVDSDSTY